ncbi:nitrite reductase small subunit NirD [Janibacter sp. GXQ6167]|uniref:nitrite reductase small subunit NirD n=1 Tax=Janibacter sp. GXQ6167 TaxID=3240791 RepID=UPI003524DAF3
MSAPATTTSVDICGWSDLVPERGVAALVDGQQIAIFRLHDDRVVALQNEDPYSGAMVLSRGLIGTKGDRTVVISPMYKQAFDVVSGECLETKGGDPRSVTVYAVRVVDGRVVLEVTRRTGVQL